ncbi:PfkB family carbohydrate kinase [Kineococcus gynurae]|uniref:PfkB family carbohydrate kinase n=1 Tax=Kineococcus gynurae TaxID=452979 RepID=A0ABV5LV70_9ACTN
MNSEVVPRSGPFDVHVRGTVFLDIVLTGLEAEPAPGTEVWTTGMGSCPGGIANMATAAARLGLTTSLASAFSTDAYGDFCWRTLGEQEGIDLSWSRRVDDWHSPVTVSLAYGGDRAMVTHEHPAPGDERPGVPGSRAVLAHLDAEPQSWVVEAHRAGSLVFADVGWDAAAGWSHDVLAGLAHCHAFLPNHVEAMGYTRTEDPRAAVRALADLVPVAVVTRGRDGAVAVDSATGEEAEVPGLPFEALDATGAGDVFGAGFLAATLRDWPLVDRLAFANLCAGLSVQQFGGSLSAPGWGDIADWWQHLRSGPRTGRTAELVRRYGFLGDVIGGELTAEHDRHDGDRPVRRATATLSRLSDLPRGTGAPSGAADPAAEAPPRS